MKRILVALAGIISLSSTHAAIAQEKYDRALVFTGGGFFNASVYVGVLDGLASKGWNPDVVIGSGGASMAAAIINAYPKDTDRNAYLERQSGGFFDLLTLAKVNPDVTGYFAKAGLTYHAASMSRLAGKDESEISVETYPDIFKGTILLIDNGFADPTMSHQFHNETGAIRAVIVGSRLKFAACDAKEECSGKKLYTETFFTDGATSELLKGFRSPIATDPKFAETTTITPETETVTNLSLGDAVRASIAAPYAFPPQVNGQTIYGSGEVDLYPIEAALQIANEVIVVYDGPFQDTSEGAIRNTFGYSINRRRTQALGKSVAQKVNLTVATDDSDSNKPFSAITMNPEVNIATVSITPRISKDNFRDFAVREKAQKELGKKAGTEAAPAPEVVDPTPSDQRILLRGLKAVEAWPEQATKTSEDLKNRFSWVRSILVEAPWESPYTELKKRYNDDLKRLGAKTLSWDEIRDLEISRAGQ